MHCARPVEILTGGRFVKHFRGDSGPAECPLSDRVAVGLLTEPEHYAEAAKALVPPPVIRSQQAAAAPIEAGTAGESAVGALGCLLPIVLMFLLFAACSGGEDGGDDGGGDSSGCVEYEERVRGEDVTRELCYDPEIGEFYDG